MIYYVRGEKFRLAWIETFGAYWCLCYKQTNTPDGSATALTEVPGSSPVVKRSSYVRQKTSNTLKPETIVELHGEVSNY